VDYKPHEILEDDVNSYLRSKGYYIHQSTYHAIMPPDLAGLLAGRFSLTSLYFRGRADRIAVHQDLPIEFEWEAKTHHNRKYNDLTIEAYPLIHHISKSKLGVDCLYAARVNGRDTGFWVSEMPEIRCVFLPDRGEYRPIKGELIGYFQDYFPNKEIIQRGVNGSGDPFVIVDEMKLEELVDWRLLIDRLSVQGV
jgi:hypothetical protein